MKIADNIFRRNSNTTDIGFEVSWRLFTENAEVKKMIVENIRSPINLSGTIAARIGIGQKLHDELAT
jgi:hypothetical protein